MPERGERRSRLHEAHAIADRKNGRSLCAWVEHFDIGGPDQMPSAGCLRRIHAGLRLGYGHGSRGHPLARRVAAWKHESRIKRAEIRKSGNEPDDEDTIIAACVNRDHFARGETASRCNLIEIFSVVANRNFVVRGRPGGHLDCESIERRQSRDEICVKDSAWIVMNRERRICRNYVVNSRKARRRYSQCFGYDAIVELLGYFIAERDRRGAVAKW